MDTVTDTDRRSNDRPLRVLLVDDDAMVRAGLTMMLGGAVDIDVVGEAADGHEAVRKVDALRPEVVLMDIRMPRLDGLQATKAVMSRPRPPRVIVLTTFDADAHIVEALSAGAEGFLLKDTPPADIVEAIRRVASDEPMLSPSVTRAILARLRDSDTSARAREARRRLAALTDRERDVASAVGRGLSNSEIAIELHLAVPTVKGHVAQLFSKLGVVNRVQVAMCVHAAGQDWDRPV